MRTFVQLKCNEQASPVSSEQLMKKTATNSKRMKKKKPSNTIVAATAMSAVKVAHHMKWTAAEKKYHIRRMRRLLPLHSPENWRRIRYSIKSARCHLPSLSAYCGSPYQQVANANILTKFIMSKWTAKNGKANNGEYLDCANGENTISHKRRSMKFYIHFLWKRNDSHS